VLGLGKIIYFTKFWSVEIGKSLNDGIAGGPIPDGLGRRGRERGTRAGHAGAGPAGASRAGAGGLAGFCRKHCEPPMDADSENKKPRRSAERRRTD